MTEQEHGPDDLTQVVPTPDSTERVAAPLTPALQPVAVAPGDSPKTSRGRWAIAVSAAVLIVAITAGIVFALIGRSPDAAVLGYVPAGAVVYGEVRLDLPGDQRREIGEFLSKFPGFADQTALDTKLDEVLDQVVGQATDGKQSFTADIKPWFGGELAFSVGPLPDPSTLGQTAANGSMDTGNALVLLSVKDAAVAQTWFDAAFKEAGATTTTETYGGSTLTVFGGSDGPQAAFAIIDGKVAVAGEVDSVKAAIDTKGDGGFADEPDPKAALDSADGDHIAFVYVALKPLVAWAGELGSAIGPDLGGSAPSAHMSEAMVQFLPDWGAYWLRGEGDAVVMEATAPQPQTVLGPTQNRDSPIADHVPATAIALAVGHDTGKTLQQTLDLYKGDADMKPITDVLEQGLGALGGADNALGWIGDTGLVVNRSGDAVEGGLLIVPTDAADAAQFFTSVKNLASLSGVPGITFRDEDHNGTTISVASIDLGGIVGAVPTAFALPIDKIEIAWAVTDDLVVLGSGPAFVAHVLDTTDSTSLASDDRYESLMARAGTGTGSLFVDIAAIRDIAEGFVKDADASALKDYESDIKPYLAPLDALVASNSVEGDLTSSKVIITVK